MLVFAPLHTGVDALLRLRLGEIVALKDKEVLVVVDDHAVKIRKTAVAEGQIVNSIQQIGLAHAVASHKAVELMRENNAGLSYVFIIDYG